MTVAIPEREPDQLAGVGLPEYQRQVKGHRAAIAALRTQMHAGRLPGSILIHGPRGIGKATLAFDIAREVFTLTGDEPAGQIAEQVASGGYPNLFVLRRAARESGKGFYTVIRVDEVRRFVVELRMTRGRAGHRIAIVDAIDDCNPSSANALLKILEEPPPDTTFLLVSHRPGSLLPTVRSRCFRVALRPVADDDVRAVLGEQMPDKEPPDIELAVDLAGGRPRQGFEALLMGHGGEIGALRGWLSDPVSAPTAARIALADTLGATRDGAELRFARRLIGEWIAREAETAATEGAAARLRLASANELWDKARLSLADADEYNLDMRLTLVALFDAITRHQQVFVGASEP